MSRSEFVVDVLQPQILREYDIRGIVPEDLSQDTAYTIGRAFGTVVVRAGGAEVNVGRDGRLSSRDIETGLVRGLSESGLRVNTIGLGPTPLLYFSTAATDAAAGVMVTGSHNPPNFNGFKLVLNGKPFFGERIQHLGDLVAQRDFHSARPGPVLTLPIQESYLARLLHEIPAGRELKVVWDCGNGATGEVILELVDRLPGQHTVLFGDIDGCFPNHHPDPTEPHNLVDLQQAVIGAGADVGLAFDGDGDRLGVIDSRGRIIWGDTLLMLYAEEILAAAPGAMVIADVKSSDLLFRGIADAGGQPLMYRTGHSHIKAKMAETGALLAGEMSGHFFFADRWYGFDDALYAALRLLRIMAARKAGWLADRIDRMPAVVNTPELRIDCPDSRKFDIVAEVQRRLDRDGIVYSAVDGLRAGRFGGWWLLRASNTQPALVVRCEAQDDASLVMLKKELGRYLRDAGLHVDLR